MNSHVQKLETAINAAVKAGNILSKHSGEAFNLARKRKESFRDIATEADTSAEDIIVHTISERDDLPIMCEESGIVGCDIDLNGNYWIVDPLDGSVNYIHQIPFYAVSVAYIENGTPVVGVIYNPSQNELFYGAIGLGVYKNHNKISIIDRNPEDALFSVSFSGKKYDNKDRNLEFENFRKVNDNSMGCLRTGSAALNLAYLAEGRLGGCMGRSTKIWDVAAGFVIAKLAGAIVKYDYDKSTPNLVNYTAVVPQSQHFLSKFTA